MCMIQIVKAVLIILLGEQETVMFHRPSGNMVVGRATKLP